MGSEHIPGVLFEIAALQALDLSHTKLNALPVETCTARLTQLHLNANFFHEVHELLVVGQSPGLRVVLKTHGHVECNQVLYFIC